MSEQIGGLLIPWTEQDEQRHQWMLDHFRTCITCDLYPRDGEGTMCDALLDVLDAPERGTAGGGGHAS